VKRHQSERSHAILDIPSRLAKARKVAAILSDFTDLSTSTLLDIGVGAGVITAELAKRCRSVTGVDVVDERVIAEGYDFRLVEGEALPFDDESFDVVVSNHVVPHVRDQERHVAEIHRVLRRGGLAYVAAPNRLFDGNYRLPLLPVLPRPLARRYFRVVYGREYDVQPLGPIAFRRLLARFSERHDATRRVLRDPERYGEPSVSRLAPVFRAIPEPALAALGSVIPTFICVARK